MQKSGDIRGILHSTFLPIIRQLYERLKATSINWVFTGSLAFAIQGIAVRPNDIDIQTDETGAYEVERLFSEHVSRKVTFSSTEKIRSHFGALLLNGITVEIMGAIQKNLPDGSWEEPVSIERYKRFVPFEGMSIPVLTLEYEYEAYRTMGRNERAALIKGAIQDT